MAVRMNHKGIPRRTPADTTGDVSRVLAKVQRLGHDGTLLRILANDTTAFRPFIVFASALFVESPLSPALRETVILHMAQRNGIEYEWSEHVPIARSAGLSDADIEELRLGGVPSTTESTPLAIEVADALMDERDVSPELWAAAVEALGIAGCLDLVLMIGWWGGLVPIVIGALGLELPDDPAAAPDRVERLRRLEDKPLDRTSS